jgi:ATP adenylyltransferase
MPYIERILAPKDAACFFCEHIADEPARYRENLVLVVQEHAVCMLNRFPFSPCHVLVAPRRHVPDITDLDDVEYIALMALVRDARVRLNVATKCTGTNIGFNLGVAAGASLAEHVHCHLVPRWDGDLNFMPVIADIRVMPEALDATWGKLHAAFADVPGVHAP